MPGAGQPAGYLPGVVLPSNGEDTPLGHRPIKRILYLEVI